MAKQKRQSTPGDMVRSMAILMIPLVLITIFFTRNTGDAPVEPVDWQPVLTSARDEAPYPVLAPTNLPQGWVPTRVTWEAEKKGAEANRWMLGWLDPGQTYFAVEQSDAAPGPFIDRVGREPRAEGTSQVGGQQWERQVSEDGRTRTLVQRSDKVTTIVAADAPYEALEAFAGTLSSS
ncbi:DUF4245 domain-containing protein [Propionibacteriaceae bacterium Y1700]|uniref:DUF4245 domain-containing protein n=1 Tax=Microlunatus sp. Y1700 TaxID=3418487 RepID=UPI003DA78C45